MLGEKTSGGRHPRVVGVTVSFLSTGWEKLESGSPGKDRLLKQLGPCSQLSKRGGTSCEFRCYRLGDLVRRKADDYFFLISKKHKKQKHLWSILMIIKPQRALKQRTSQNDHCHPWHYQKSTFDFQRWQKSIFKGVQVIQIIFLVWRRKI